MRVKVLKITQFPLRNNHAEDASYDASFVYSMICYYPSENKRLHFYLDSKVDGNYQVIMEGDYLDLELNEDGTVKSVTIDETSNFFLRFWCEPWHLLGLFLRFVLTRQAPGDTIIIDICTW